jgi:hypothetical protein
MDYERPKFIAKTVMGHFADFCNIVLCFNKEFLVYCFNDEVVLQ